MRKWKKVLTILGFYLCWTSTYYGQGDTLKVEGEVSYTTSRNVYVRFASTADLTVGDSLYAKVDDRWVSVLQIQQMSSISCVASGKRLSKGDRVFALIVQPAEEAEVPVLAPVSIASDQNITLDSLIAQNESLNVEEELHRFKQKIRGRLSISDQMSFEEDWLHTNQRFRSSFSLNAQHINNSGISFQTYLIHRYNLNNQSEAVRSAEQTFRVLSASLTYDWEDKATFSFGRRINNRIANVGAIDGVQASFYIDNWEFGGVAGSRPSIREYSYDPSLFEFGGYIAHSLQKGGSKVMENTLAFFEQRNGGAIDRRFAYFQHNSSPTRTLSVFSSFEFDLYQKIGAVTNVQPRLSSLFISLRYRFSRSFSIYTAYDARRNIVFFETNKLLVDQLLDEALREGYRIRFNWRVWKYISWGASGALRVKRNDPFQSINANSYVNISRIPWVKASINLSYNYLSSSFSDGNIYAAQLTKNFFNGRLSGTLQYRHASYTFGSSEFVQDIFGLNLNWRLIKKLSLGINYEGAFSSSRTNQRLHFNLVQRF